MDGALALTSDEDRLWGIRLDGDLVTLRPTGWLQLGALAQVGIACAFLMLLYRLGAQRQLLVGVAAAFLVVAMAAFQGMGTVVATPQGLTRWWFGRRRVFWDQIESFEVVDATLRDGTTLTLWPTRSAQPRVEGRPSPAAVQCGLLERYRATLAP